MVARWNTNQNAIRLTSRPRNPSGRMIFPFTPNREHSLSFATILSPHICSAVSPLFRAERPSASLANYSLSTYQKGHVPAFLPCALGTVLHCYREHIEMLYALCLSAKNKKI